MEIGKESVGQSTSRDAHVLERRKALFNNTQEVVEDILANFPTFTRRVSITRFLAHYELFKKISNLPGSIVELGVFKGASLFAFAHFLEIFCHGDRSRKVIGFDSFEGLSGFSEKDGPAVDTHSKVLGGWSAGNFENDLMNMINLFTEESFVPQSPRICLVKGDINSTVSEYVKSNPGLRISLLHFDCDLYEPTLAGLKQLVPHVVAGGLIVFDEYAITAWAGETSAVDEFFGRGKRIEKFNWTSLPGGYIQM
jgi:hypothetical protein